MAQSTQSTQYNELARVINRFVFADTTTPTSGDNFDVITDIIRRGLRKFYMPPPLPGDNYAHVWSFLKKKATLDVRGKISSTATTAMGGTTAVIDTTSTFTTNLGTSGDALIDSTVTAEDVSTGITYTSQITATTNSTTLVVADTWSSNLDSTSDTYTISNVNWTLPDDFGALLGDMTYESRTTFPPLKLVSENRIRTLRQDTGLNQFDRPRFMASRPKTQHTASSAGTRWEVMFWPEPDSTYTFDYRYWVAVDELVRSGEGAEKAFPAGAIHGEAIMAACMWVAQEYADPQNSQFNMHERYIEAMRASVMFDRQMHGGEYGGYNADGSDTRGLGVPFRDRVSNVTYNNTEYP